MNNHREDVLSRIKTRVAVNRKVGNLACCIDLSDLEALTAKIAGLEGEVTDEMLKAGREANWKLTQSWPSDEVLCAIYRAMRSAALSPKDDSFARPPGRKLKYDIGRIATSERRPYKDEDELVAIRRAVRYYEQTRGLKFKTRSKNGWVEITRLT